ncbi:MAG: 3-hydroxyisobutyrate dehydrogenase [Chloroflexi bacterium]|jgi:3-hydroxyisobutyrate dehydrogenase|nr:3-hydroxyisobutyrate dehydrogenase [Chloroflexota bacterium]MCH2536281.1 NAD(P)-dependent oxidoreductase [Dehalococcoidia bacterium]MEE2928816.1 NAD(P)-dependent oxidoreductase [Chloroflexota bacterium]HIB10648.1 NAD(P)-dependent oxidoreductase [Dehalococcoidia bacterium]HIM50231.1 NAD(P)-dependent oxidoreductase [Dehalococcoidia bacterium]|tara:strand:- start:587 stop:1537 length:951 start_codon:yes stop_codon:yes gene_type:complete
METVGFIGLGNMGGGMSANIQRAGYPMVVYDLREEAAKPLLEGGARLANSPAEVASLCDITLTSLPGPKEVESVSTGPEGVLEGMKLGGIYIDLSTSRPTLIREIEPKFRQKGCHVLDAPVSGGKSGAASGNLAVMVGGEREIFDRVKPILDSFGDKVFYAGSIGAGSVAKLVHNMIGHGVRQAIAEGLTLGVKAGVDAEALWECVRRGSLGRMSGLHEGIARTVFTGEFDPPSFALELSRKDIGLATDLGREFNVPMPVANLAEQIAIQGMNRGWGGRDSSVTFLLQEEQAGVEVRAAGVDPVRAGRFITTHPEA